MSGNDLLELFAGRSRLLVAPTLGGAVLAYEDAGRPLFHPVVDPKLREQHGEAVAAYPLIPFSNRIAAGRFSFGGEDFTLAHNFGDRPYTIHGNAWMHAWTVADRSDSTVRLTLEHGVTGGGASEWPYRYAATLEYALRPDGLDVGLAIRNTDVRPQPVGFGIHPFFPRDGNTELYFSARSVWRIGDDELPAERLPIAPGFGFEPSRRVEAGPTMDTCFNGWFGSAAISWPDRGLELEMTATPPFGHLVVYIPPGKDYLAFEPVSNMNDAINRLDEPDNGLRVLPPQETLVGRVNYNLVDRSR